MTKTQIKSLAAFCEASHLNSKLIAATVRQFGGWQSFKELAADVCRGGIDGQDRLAVGIGKETKQRQIDFLIGSLERMGKIAAEAIAKAEGKL